MAFSIAITKLSRSKNFSYIQQFLNDLRTSRPDLRTSERFTAHAVVLFGQASMVNHAIRTFEEYHKDVVGEGNKESVKVFNGLLFASYLIKNYSEVNRVFLEFPKRYDFEPNLDSYNTVIKSFCDSGSSISGFSVLSEMDRMLSRRMKPNSATYTHLIHGFCNVGNLGEAKRLFKDMVNKGCRPDSVCYFTLFHFLYKARDFETALAICKDRIAKQWVPNIATMTSLVNGLAGVGKVDEAKELVRQIKGKFTKNVSVWDEIETRLSQ